MKVAGIPCGIDNARVQKAIDVVIRQIQSRAPLDYQRICDHVKAFTWLPEQEAAKGILGRWKRKSGGEVWERGSGAVQLARKVPTLPEPRLIATIAHELGHVATREEDFWKRDGVDAEWASEACADYYAYKWGFGRQIRADYKANPNLAHRLLPGEIIEIEGIGAFKMTRHFYLRPL